MQKDGVNYLIPLNHNVNSPEQLKYKTVNAKMVLEEMEAAQSFLNVVILDACRDSPFRSFRGTQTGLSSMNAPAGSIVIFSTHEGGTAFDGVVNGRNGLFTSHLLAAMQNGNQEIESIFKATSKKVQVDAKSYEVKQIPFLSSSFNEQFCFGICGNGQSVAPQPAAPAYVPPAPKPAPVVTRSGIEPEMVLIPAGTFEMGSNDGFDNEKPVKSWKLNGFYMSKYETTIGQYLACVQDGACNQPEWLESGSEYNIRTGSNKDYYGKRGMSESNKNNPITGVSWKDAVAYGEWLSKKTGKTYRLPTEAEWEYAARAGSTTKYWWGDNIGSNKANCDGCGSQWDNKQTAPVGSFSSNGFGLYDTVGNVWEWTCSEYAAYSEGKQTQCNQSVTGLRVLRGGSWFDDAYLVRSAYRTNYGATDRNYNLGFRLISVP
jgi:formylglycine-generating enzyme required for sulfatase activity